MVFSSALFLLYFLPVFLLFYYLTPGIWKNYTARDCLTKYEGHQSMYNNELKIREIEGNELQLIKVMEKNNETKS